jgi:hypothetical protein
VRESIPQGLDQTVGLLDAVAQLLACLGREMHHLGDLGSQNLLEQSCLSRLGRSDGTRADVGR